MDQKSDFQAVIDAARRGVEPQPVSISPLGGGVLYLPNANHGLGELVALEKFATAPERKRGTVEVFDAASFNQVLRDNADAGDVVVYIDRNPEKPVVEAVLNSNGAGGPGWGDFRCRIRFNLTPQWAKWRAIDGKLLPQSDFAEFVEDNLADIADPPGAAMLEIVTELQAKRTVDFRRAVVLGSGQVQFEHTENLEAKVGPGQLAVPQSMTLALAPLQGCPKYQVPARFRYRLTDGKLTLGIKLQRVEDLMRDVLEDVVAKIERGAHVVVLEGLAPAPTR